MGIVGGKVSKTVLKSDSTRTPTTVPETDHQDAGDARDQLKKTGTARPGLREHGIGWRPRRGAELRTVRGDGTPLSDDDAVALLERGGLVNVRPVESAWQAPIRFVAGQRP